MALRSPNLTSSAPSKTQQDELTERLLIHIDNPVECFLDTFWDYLVENEKDTGIEPENYLDQWQKEVLMASAERNYIAITGANNVGKSTIASIFIWTYHKTRHNAVGQCTSIDSIQLHRVLWAELSRWYNRSLELQAAFEFVGNSFYNRRHKDEWWMLARTARKQSDVNIKGGGAHSTGLQGIHGPHVIMVIDEGSGVEDPNWEAAESSIREEDNKLFAISNPLKVSGRMFEIFHVETFRKYWYTRQVSYKECARIDKKMAEEQIAMLGGESNPVVQIRFLGQFPERGSDDTLPTYQQVKDAMSRARQVDSEAIDILTRLVDGGVPVKCHYTYDQLKDYQVKFSFERENDFLPEYMYSAKVSMPKPPSRWLDLVAKYFAGPCRMGVDLARFGSSETVFAVSRNNRIVEMRPRFHFNTLQILATIEEIFHTYAGMDLVIVDKTGLYGEAVCDLLSTKAIPSIAVGFGEDAIVSDDFKNQATEMWFGIANGINSMMLPYDSQLLAQLTTRKYKFTGKKLQKVIEDKDSMKTRHLPSPDRADSVGLAFKKVMLMTDEQIEATYGPEEEEIESEGSFIPE